METGCSIKKLNHSYGENVLFRDFDISFLEKEINCILGPSGCGKTTLLNIIAGLTKPGTIETNEFIGRRVSYIFQDPRLLPWLNVEDNIRIVLKDLMPAEDVETRLEKYISMVRERLPRGKLGFCEREPHRGIDSHHFPG